MYIQNMKKKRKKKEKKRVKRGEIIKSILLAAGIVVGFGASLVMPGLPIGLKAIMEALEDRDERISRREVKRTLKNLEKRKIISLKEVEGELLVTFKEKGKELLLRYKIDELEIKKPRRWDKKWRIVAFDIPEKKKLAREVLRQKLKDLGFRPIQKSVFVIPYECQREIELIKRVYEIEPFIRFIEADFIDNQEKFIKLFDL